MTSRSKNPLVTRRGFLERALDAAKVAGAGAAFIGLDQPGSARARAAINPWAYDDTPFRRTEPGLIRYHEIRRFRPAHASPTCLAASPSGELLVGSGHYVTLHAPNGEPQSEIALGEESRGVAPAPDGSVCVALREHVEIYDAKGQRRAAWDSPGSRTYLTAIAAGADDVFVADAGNRVVHRYDRSGKIKLRIGEKNKERNIPGFIVPSPFFDLEIAPDGLLRVTNPGRHCVEAYTFDGDLEFSWGRPGAAIENFCGCCNPIGVKVFKDGRVVTAEKGIPRVKVYGARGTFESVVAGAESFAENAKVCGPNDCTLGGLRIATDGNGRVYILDLVAGDVRVLERNSEAV